MTKTKLYELECFSHTLLPILQSGHTYVERLIPRMIIASTSWVQSARPCPGTASLFEDMGNFHTFTLIILFQKKIS